MQPQRTKVIQFDPRTNDGGHFVEVHVSRRAGLAGPAGTTYVTCNCPAGQEYWANLRLGNRVTGCWAMQEARRMIEAPTPRFQSGVYGRFIYR